MTECTKNKTKNVLYVVILTKNFVYSLRCLFAQYWINIITYELTYRNTFSYRHILCITIFCILVVLKMLRKI